MDHIDNDISHNLTSHIILVSKETGHRTISWWFQIPKVLDQQDRYVCVLHINSMSVLSMSHNFMLSNDADVPLDKTCQNKGAYVIKSF